MVENDELRELIAEAQGGNVRSFELLMAAHFSQVRRFARAFARSDSDADDLAQDALVKVYKSLRSFRFQSTFKTWLYSVVRHVFIDAVRSRAGRERSLEDALPEDHAQLPSPSESADLGLERMRTGRSCGGPCANCPPTSAPPWCSSMWRGTPMKRWPPSRACPWGP